MLVAPLDPAPYLRPPRFGVASGLSLSKMLLIRIPKAPSPGIILAAQALAVTVVATETDWKAQAGPKPVPKARAADLRLDRGWRVVQRRLGDHESFEPDDPDRLRSVELGERLFPTGLDFTQLRYIEEHAHSHRLLTIIDEEGLRLDLDRLVGERFMLELLAAHEHYGVVLGITAAPEAAPPPISMLDRLRALSQAISAYALQVLAYAGTDPLHLAPAQHALEPIDAFREAARKATRSQPRPQASTEPDVDDADDYALPEGAPAPDAPMPAVPMA